MCSNHSGSCSLPFRQQQQPCWPPSVFICVLLSLKYNLFLSDSKQPLGSEQSIWWSHFLLSLIDIPYKKALCYTGMGGAFSWRGKAVANKNTLINWYFPVLSYKNLLGNERVDGSYFCSPFHFSPWTAHLTSISVAPIRWPASYSAFT